MRKLLTIATSPLTFYILCCALILSLNLTPLIAHIRHSPEGRSFALIHNNAQDFFFYQAIMNEGANGQWLTTDPYTTEPHQPSLIFAYFVWLGKLGKLLGMTPAITYHVMRIIFSVCFMAVSWMLIRSLKVPYPRLTSLFFLFAGGYMHLLPDGLVVPFMHWWTGMDPVRRIAYLPHHMFGNVFLVVSLFSVLHYIETKQNKWIYLAFASIPFLAFVHPPSTFLILLILPGAYVLYVVRNLLSTIFRALPAEKKHTTLLILPVKQLILIGAYLGVSGLILMSLVSLTGKGFPWTQYINFEKDLQFPLDRELIGALGLVYPIALCGIIFAIWTGTFESILIASWFAIPLLLIPFAKMINISNIRFIQAAPFLPMAILGAWGIQMFQHIITKIKNHSQPTTHHSQQKVSNLQRTTYNLQRNILPALVGSIFLIFSFPAINWSVRDQIREYWPIFGNVYLDNRLWKAFDHINLNYPPKTKTLSTFYSGNYLPAHTYTISYVGHFGYTNEYDKKNALIEKFLKSQMTDGEAKQFISSEKIDLVFQGPEEKYLNPKPPYLYPGVLKVVYDTEEVTMYTLKR